MLLGVEGSREDSTFVQSNLTNVGPVNIYTPVYTYPATAPATVHAFDFAGIGDGTALYAQDLVSLSPAWDVIVGLRHSRLDYTQTNDGVRDAVSYTHLDVYKRQDPAFHAGSPETAPKETVELIRGMFPGFLERAHRIARGTPPASGA